MHPHGFTHSPPVSSDHYCFGPTFGDPKGHPNRIQREQTLGHPIFSESNDVDLCLKYIILQCSTKKRPFPKQGCTICDSAPLTVPSAINAFTHPLGTERVIPIESRGGTPLEQPLCPESNDESCIIQVNSTIIYKNWPLPKPGCNLMDSTPPPVSSDLYGFVPFFEEPKGHANRIQSRAAPVPPHMYRI